MNTADQNGKHTNKAPQGYVIVKASNGTVIKKQIPAPKKTLLQKIFGK